MDQSEDETQNPLSDENCVKQNNWKFIKYLIHHRHPMTPEQFKQKLFEEIFRNQHEKVDTEEGESNGEEEKSTTSSDKSEQDSKSDITLESKKSLELWVITRPIGGGGVICCFVAKEVMDVINDKPWMHKQHKTWLKPSMLLQLQQQQIDSRSD